MVFFGHMFSLCGGVVLCCQLILYADDKIFVTCGYVGLCDVCSVVLSL